MLLVVGSPRLPLSRRGDSPILLDPVSAKPLELRPPSDALPLAPGIGLGLSCCPGRDGALTGSPADGGVREPVLWTCLLLLGVSRCSEEVRERSSGGGTSLAVASEASLCEAIGAASRIEGARVALAFEGGVAVFGMRLAPGDDRRSAKEAEAASPRTSMRF